MTLDLPEIARYMRMGRTVPEGELAERVAKLRDRALKCIRVASVWRRFPIERGRIAAGPSGLAVCGTLARHLAGCHAAYLACGTIGAEFDRLQRCVSVSSGADALIMQAIGAAAIEKAMDETEGEIRADLSPDEKTVSRYSPGYGDFPLEAQRDLLRLLDAPKSVGVSLTDTLLMVPSKSVSAVIGVKKGAQAE